jgi:hypothetical protein
MALAVALPGCHKSEKLLIGWTKATTSAMCSSPRADERAAKTKRPGNAAAIKNYRDRGAKKKHTQDEPAQKTPRTKGETEK